MQPNQPEHPHDPQRYDFFLNPPTQPQKSKLPGMPGVRDPFLKKVVLLIGGGISVVIIVVILASVIFSGGGSSADLTKIAQQQNELIRVAGEAGNNAVQQTTKSLAVGVQLSLTSSQQQLLAYAKKQHQTITAKELVLTKSSATDQQLNNAKTASNFDAVFAQIVQQQLQTYTQTIKQDFNATSNTNLRQLLNTEYKAGSLLLAQASSAVSALQAQ